MASKINIVLKRHLSIRGHGIVNRKVTECHGSHEEQTLAHHVVREAEMSFTVVSTS